jgi:hypothetical protein
LRFDAGEELGSISQPNPGLGIYLLLDRLAQLSNPDIALDTPCIIKAGNETTVQREWVLRPRKMGVGSEGNQN